jgi:hypothetical protein
LRMIDPTLPRYGTECVVADHWPTASRGIALLCEAIRVDG